ncbi:nitrite reductase (NAD(P)H) small subunit [Carbonactinospora thermoautotrophica]|uniref:nitrite reductase small subunit NirD n=1 Tax=Carbonactinospora thermoautotrophica TaxID=1469144 RepID=UPI00226EBF2A|nr:nitrite reductase small subunit NirD [Carbonactinospora thermoautotrophica]MCX9191605.1 nitrite reductase (NAD(P)H) small subunit [Carbonactinospora thermoautotrophica]
MTASLTPPINTPINTPINAVLTERWVPVCMFDDLLPERGVAAMVAGEQVAVFRTYDGSLFAIGNLDPFSGAYVLSRGIVGTRGEVPTVASPMYKQVFDLRTGVCLDDPRVSVPVYPIRCRDGVVEVAARKAMTVVQPRGGQRVADAPGRARP